MHLASGLFYFGGGTINPASATDVRWNCIGIPPKVERPAPETDRSTEFMARSGCPGQMLPGNSTTSKGIATAVSTLWDRPRNDGLF